MGMQGQPLLVTSLIDHAAREHAGRKIVSRWADGSMTRSNWGEVGADARRFAAAMVRLGMKKGDRIATLAMNHGHHLVSWRSEEHTSQLQSLMRISYAVFCLKKKTTKANGERTSTHQTSSQ